MAKYNNPLSEDSTTRVTRSTRRSGSIDLDFGQSSQHTPLKAHLETISETGSLDSITPRRSTRRSVAHIDLSTPHNTSHLTKANLARLENLNDSIENSPSIKKRVVRRASVTSEDSSIAPKSVPYVQLVSCTTPKQGQQLIPKTPTRRGRSKKNSNSLSTTLDESTEETENTVKNNLSSSTSKIDKTDESTKLDKTLTPTGSIKLKHSLKKTNTASNVKTENHSLSENETIEILESSSGSNSDDSDTKDEPEYYRNTSLKKFRGTIKNNLDEENPEDQSNMKSVDKIPPLDNKKHTDNETINLNGAPTSENNEQNISPKERNNLSLNDKIDATESEETMNSRTLHISQIKLNTDNNAFEIDVITKNSEASQNQTNKNDEKSNDEVPDQFNEIIKTPSSSRKSTPTKKTTPVKIMTPAKPASLLKQITPSKSNTAENIVTPAKLETTIKEVETNPLKIDTPLKLTQGVATPAKPGTSHESPTKLTKSFEINESTNELLHSKNITVSPCKSISSTSSHIEISANGSKFLLIQEDDVSIKVPMENGSNKDTTINVSLSTSSPSSDEPQNADLTDHSIVDPFENYNLFREKAKSGSSIFPKHNLLQSQIMSSSFHAVRNLEKELEEDDQTEFNDSKSNVSKIQDDFIEKVNDSVQTKTNLDLDHFRNRLTFVIKPSTKEPDDEINTAIKQDVLLIEKSPVKKRFTSIGAVVTPLATTMSESFVDNDHVEVAQDVSKKDTSVKKHNQRSSIVEPVIDSIASEIGLFAEHDEIQNLSNKNTSSPKKGKNRSLPSSDSVIPLAMKSFVGDDDNENDTGAAKKPKRQSFAVTEAEISNTSVSGFFIETDNHDEILQNISAKDTNSPKKHNRRLSVAGTSLNSSSGFFLEIDNHDETAQLNVSKNSSKTHESRLNASESPFVVADNNNIVDESEEAKMNSFVTKRKHKLQYNTESSDIKHQATDSLNTSAGAFVETDNENANVSSSKIERSKMKTPSKDKENSAKKREIPIQEIAARCNKILEERELARKMLREQFSKKKVKKQKKRKSNEDEDSTIESIGCIDKTEENSKPLEQQKFQIITPEGLNTADKQKNTSSFKVQSNKHHNVAENKQNTPQIMETVLPKNKKVKLAHMQNDDGISSELPSGSNRRLPDHLLNQLDEKIVSLKSTQSVRSSASTKRKLVDTIDGNEEQISPVKIKTNKFVQSQVEGQWEISSPISKKRRLADDILNQLEDKPIIANSPKKIKFPKFFEKEKTPEIRPSGFKVSPITPKILSNKFRVSIMPQQERITKKKLKFNEPTNSLAQPVWTTAGIFEETDVQKKNRKQMNEYSTTNFIVEDIGDSFKNRYGKIDKQRKAELTEFKTRSLFGSRVSRKDAKHVYKSKLFQTQNIKSISK